MSAPNPNDFKNVIPGATSGLCEKLRNLLVSLPQLVANWVAFEFTDAGTFSDDYKALLCTACTDGSTPGSGGTNPQNPNMPAPTGITATDGTFSDRVRVTWNAVSPPSGVDAVTQYKIYRASSDIVNPNSSVLIGTVDAPTLTYDDLTAIVGTTYNYWVVATNGTQISAYGGPNAGNAGAPTTTIPAVSDLIATQGVYGTGGGPAITLEWTAPTGATKYDVYRNTVNDSSTATKVESDIVPILGTSQFSPADPSIWDNGDSISYNHTAPDSLTKYYFWVIAKKDAPPAVSPFSNSAQGWGSIVTPPFNGSSIIFQSAVQLLACAIDTGADTFTHVAHGYANGSVVAIYGTPPAGTSNNTAYYIVGATSNTFQVSLTSGGAAINLTTTGSGVGTRQVKLVPVGMTTAYVVGIGSAGGGAGGGTVYGGGGGGGGAVVVETFSVIAGDYMVLEASPDNQFTGNAPTMTNGDDGASIAFKINGVTKISITPGTGGVFNPAGGGAGGSGGIGTGTTSPIIYNGHAGLPASGGSGGGCGYAFGLRRLPGANQTGLWDGNGQGVGGAGGGSYPNSSAPTLAVGGRGVGGAAYVGLHS